MREKQKLWGEIDFKKTKLCVLLTQKGEKKTVYSVIGFG